MFFVFNSAEAILNSSRLNEVYKAALLDEK